jgi:ribosome-associated protein
MTDEKKNAATLAALCAKVADEMKAENITTLDLNGLTIIADYFVVCTGNSTPHLAAILEKIMEKVKDKLGKRPYVTPDKTAAAGWVALDYGSVIIHIFSKEQRDKYRLESFWDDAVIKKPAAKKTTKRKKYLKR